MAIQSAQTPQTQHATLTSWCEIHTKSELIDSGHCALHMSIPSEGSSQVSDSSCHMDAWDDSPFREVAQTHN